MKNKYIKLLALVFIASASVSCVNDDDTFGINSNKSTATTSVTALTIAEGESGVIPFTINNPINMPSQFKIELVGGNGTQDDITAGDSDTDADTGIAHVGFEITVPAFASSFDIPVNVLMDLDQSEGDETIKLKISAAGNRTIVTPTAYVVDLTIVDFAYCLLLEVTDSYGDGWNGGFLTVTTGGVSTDYACQDLDGETNLSETQIIPVPVSGSYSITYTDGGGGGVGPGWDSENSFIITHVQTGAEVTGGPNPPAGMVTSGTCN